MLKGRIGFAKYNEYDLANCVSSLVTWYINSKEKQHGVLYSKL